MNKYISVIVFLVSLNATAQMSPEAEVKATIETFFEGFHEGDTAKMKSVMIDKITMQTAFINKQGGKVYL